MVVSDSCLTVIGDIHLELVANLDDVPFQNITSNIQLNRRIRSLVGGTAVHVARYATSYFGTVRLIGALGQDDTGDLVVKMLGQDRIEICTTSIAESPTGIVVNLSARGPSNTGRVRLLVVQKGSNSLLTAGHVDALREVICNSSIVHVDGYSFLEQPRSDAVQHAIGIARSSNVLVSCDLVPHDIHRYLSIDELARWLNLADLVFVEARTVLALFGHGWTQNESTRENALDAWRLMQSRHARLSAFIQFGSENIHETLVCVAGSSPRSRHNGFEKEDTIGFGDRMVVQDLAKFLTSRSD
jgi:sugar/nucleoside kinase (ribokinase family)